MFFGEKLNNETRVVYEEKGYAWKPVMAFSNSIALGLGLVSFLFIYFLATPLNLNPQFLPFAVTITTYITVQSIMTDVKTLRINRNILRVAYISMYVLALYNVITNPIFRYNDIGLILFTVVLFLLFWRSSIGSSDIRAIAVAMPFSVSIDGYTGIKLLVLSLVGVVVFMLIQRVGVKKKILEGYKVKYKDILQEVGEKDFKKATRGIMRDEFRDNDQYAMPVGPFMIIPFLIYFLAYPVIIFLS